MRSIGNGRLKPLLIEGIVFLPPESDVLGPGQTPDALITLFDSRAFSVVSVLCKSQLAEHWELGLLYDHRPIACLFALRTAQRNYAPILSLYLRVLLLQAMNKDRVLIRASRDVLGQKLQKTLNARRRPVAWTVEAVSIPQMLIFISRSFPFK